VRTPSVVFYMLLCAAFLLAYLATGYYILGCFALGFSIGGTASILATKGFSY
jgi:hypothetical protein